MQQGNRKDALKDYVEVNVRVEKFWEKYPNGRIQTDLVSWENGVIVMKANVYKDINDQIPSANGFAYEKEGSTFINKTSALENCETSAVGRALALLGFEIKKSIASREEVENAKLQQREEPQSTITPEQIGEIKTKALQFAQARNQPPEKVYEALKITNFEELTGRQVMAAIKKLDKWLKAATEKQG
ncbi:hypothetical protein [Heyndrickxia coagulans]|uniref:hypothetical protein n=1 Tax=Heyndrickxia coagulans TaxID=1398 RepID=UPI000779A647|nr:hypothetical protein [Heyndrickxia coagulans]